jgi:hypothetical protein
MPAQIRQRNHAAILIGQREIRYLPNHRQRFASIGPRPDLHE